MIAQGLSSEAGLPGRGEQGAGDCTSSPVCELIGCVTLGPHFMPQFPHGSSKSQRADVRSQSNKERSWILES